MSADSTPTSTPTSTTTETPKVSFDQGFYSSVRAIQLLRQKHGNKNIFVGVAGPSGSGKTTLALKIANIMPGTLVISLDNYLDATRTVIDSNFDDYRLVDFDLLIENIKDLQENRSTEMPLYDFRKSGRYAYKKISPPESKVVLIEGIYALHESIAHFYDLRISVSGGVHYDLVKRVFRDIQRTGQDAANVLSQITNTVYPMYKAFIEPSLRLADIQIVNTFNPFSGLLSPDYILKSVLIKNNNHSQGRDNVMDVNSPSRQRIEKIVSSLRQQMSTSSMAKTTSNKSISPSSVIKTKTNAATSSATNLSTNVEREKLEQLPVVKPTSIETYIDIFLLPPEQEESSDANEDQVLSVEDEDEEDMEESESAAVEEDEEELYDEQENEYDESLSGDEASSGGAHVRKLRVKNGGGTQSNSKIGTSNKSNRAKSPNSPSGGMGGNGGNSSGGASGGGTVRDSTQYIRIRNNNGTYWALFSESLREGRFIITPHMEFLIDVKTLGGLMSLGYKVDAILNRTSIVYDVFEDKSLTLMIDIVEQLNQTYLQIKGDNQELVSRVAGMLGLKHFTTDTYIEIYHKQEQMNEKNFITSRL